MTEEERETGIRILAAMEEDHWRRMWYQHFFADYEHRRWHKLGPWYFRMTSLN